MIVQLLISHFRASDMGRCVDAYAHQGFPAARCHSTVFGIFTAASGPVNRLMQLVAYADYADLARAQRALTDDTQWTAFRGQIRDAILDESSTILNPTNFSPIRTMDHVTSATGLASDTPGGMLFELRTYTAFPGKLPRALKMLVEEGNPLTHQFVERPVAYLTSETGISNQILMLWAYSSAQERANRKSRMLPDPRFRELGARFNPNFSQQESAFWQPENYSPLR
jgi:hypothetical protein